MRSRNRPLSVRSIVWSFVIITVMMQVICQALAVLFGYRPVFAAYLGLWAEAMLLIIILAIEFFVRNRASGACLAVSALLLLVSAILGWVAGAW